MITDLMSLLFRRNFSKRKIDFAFVIHPRYTADIYRKYPILKILPKAVVDFGLFYFWPTYGGAIRGLTRDGKQIWGALIIVPMISKQMLQHRPRAKKKVLAAVKLAEVYGAEIVGLGALTSAVTGGGLDIAEASKPVHLTSGNSLTAFTTANDVISRVQKEGITGPIAIIGATGSIGHAVTTIVYEELPNQVIIVGKNPERTHAIGSELTAKNLPNKKVPICSTNVDDAESAEVLIITTSAHDAIVSDKMIANTKVIYDVTQPKNTPEHIQNSEKIVFIDGGLIKLPEEIHFTLDVGLPKGIAYSCLSETMVLASTERFDLLSGSKLNTDNIRTIGDLAKKLNFNSHQIITNHGHNV
jgi:predicted amino acid dehydrogenase